LLEKLYSNHIIKYPKIVLAIALVFLVLFSYFATKLEIDASAQTLLLEDDKDLKFTQQISKQYETQDFLIVTFSPKNADLINDSSLNQIKQLSDELLKLDLVESITSILNVPLLQSPPKPISELLKNIPTLTSKDTNKTLAKQELLSSPLYKRNLVSDNFKTTAILLNLKNDKKYNMLINEIDKIKQLKNRDKLQILKNELKFHRDYMREKNHQTIIEIRKILTNYKKYADIHLGGVSMIADDMVEFVKYDLKTFSIVVFALLTIVLYILFKELKWILIPITICSASIVATSGILGLFGWEITVISSNFISLQLIMTMSLVIHLTIKYKELLTLYPDYSQRQLALQTILQMAKPSFFVVITTIAGFSSLVFSGILPVINFGWMMSFGIGISLIITFLMFPTIVILLQKGKGLKEKQKEPLTYYIAKLLYKYQKTILSLTIITIIFSLTGATKLFVENSFIDYFKKDTEIYKGMKAIDQNLGGTTPLDIILTFKEDEKPVEIQTNLENEDFDDFSDEFEDDESSKETYWFTRYKMEKVKDVHKYLESLPQIGKVVSLSTMDEIGRILNNGKYLDSFELALLYQKLPNEYKSILLSPYINIERNQVRISTRIIDSQANLRRNELINKINTDLNQLLNQKTEEFKLSNLLILYNNMLQSLFDSQISTLGTVVIILFIMFLILFKNIPLSIVAIIANIVPVGVIFGFMGHMSIPLDMMTITIAAISIGIAVDNTIHYIHRFKIEYSKTKNYEEAVFNSHKSIGIAMFYTSTMIMIGFSVLVLSNFIPTIYFGLLTLIAMFMAIVADLLLLPVLLIVTKIKF
jgi:predicted RND superfamily exporter protein